MFDYESNQKIGKFLFTHATMIFLLLNILGVTKDPFPITYDFYKTAKGNGRNFRSSVLVPMSANVVFVLFDCQESTNELDITKKIVAYHNERPLYLERCNGYVCDWDTFKLLFKVIWMKIRIINICSYCILNTILDILNQYIYLLSG